MLFERKDIHHKNLFMNSIIFDKNRKNTTKSISPLSRSSCRIFLQLLYVQHTDVCGLPITLPCFYVNKNSRCFLDLILHIQLCCVLQSNGKCAIFICNALLASLCAKVKFAYVVYGLTVCCTNNNFINIYIDIHVQIVNFLSYCEMKYM